MKKILLIIALVFCIFQIIVLATAIDIGSVAIDRALSSTFDTYVDKNNPANASGKITSIEVWFDGGYADATDVQIATFFVVSGNNLSTRDTEAIGTVTAGSKQTIPVDLDVMEGDYIGIYWMAPARIERDNVGVGYWSADGDQIPCTDYAFPFYASRTMSLYGTGLFIDIGTPAIDRFIYFEPGYTWMDNTNPANDSGIITSVEIWAHENMSGVEVATFFLVSGSNYSTRDSHTIGNVNSGSKQTFSGLSINVQTGDYIGIYWTGGSIDMDQDGGGLRYLAGDQIPCTDATFGTSGTKIAMSLYGTGTTEAPPEEANAIFFGTNF